MTGAERFTSDAKDYDITGAMYVNGDGDDIILMLMFWQGIVWGIDTGRLMGDTGRLMGDTGRLMGDTGRLMGDTGRLMGDKRSEHANTR